LKRTRTILPPTEIEARAKRLQLLLFDVDGVLTDGSVMIGSDGWEAKLFSIRDGAGMVMAQREGLTVGLLSGRPSEATSRRAAELGITLVLQGGPDKRGAFDRVLMERSLQGEQVGYMGDDLLDLAIFSRAGLTAAPADAVPEVRDRAHWISGFGGGRGAAREFIELVLRARAQWDGIVAAVQG
jgi:3-deoxy-D-manno-octulosonate 8-phosphate phosphatase (KDO 8-P phosphatase)